MTLLESTALFLRIVWSVLCDIFYSLAANWLPSGYMKKHNIDGKVVLLTGAGSGLGRGVAGRLADLPITLVLWDINEQANGVTARMCEGRAARTVTYTVDVADRKDVYATAEKVRSEVGAVYMVINNAGIAFGRKFLDKDDARMERVVRVNMLAHFWMAKAFLPHMIEANDGHIVSITSISAVLGIKDLVDYSASKFGAFGFQEALENECYDMGKRGIHFTTVCPTYTDTPMLRNERHTLTLQSDANVVSSAYAVDEIVNALLTRKRIAFFPKENYLTYALKGILPRRTFQKLVTWKLNQ